MNANQLNDTDKAIYNHIKRDNYYYVSHDTKNFYKDIEEEYFPLPCVESLFDLATHVGQEPAEQKSFVKYLKHLEHYGANVGNMTYRDPHKIHCQSFENNTINLFDLAILTMNRPLIDYCIKNVMLPHFEEKKIHDPTHPLVSILEHGEFYLLPIYQKQGLYQLPNSFYESYAGHEGKYSEVSLLHYVAGDPYRIIHEPEFRQRAIERLNCLKDNYSYLLSGEMCDYDQAYLKNVQQVFQESISQLSKQEQRSIREFFDTMDHFFDLPLMSYEEVKENTVKKKKVNFH